MVVSAEAPDIQEVTAGSSHNEECTINQKEPNYLTNNSHQQHLRFAKLICNSRTQSKSLDQSLKQIKSCQLLDTSRNHNAGPDYERRFITSTSISSALSFCILGGGLSKGANRGQSGSPACTFSSHCRRCCSQASTEMAVCSWVTWQNSQCRSSLGRRTSCNERKGTRISPQIFGMLRKRLSSRLAKREKLD
jgi:hypothetical protein